MPKPVTPRRDLYADITAELIRQIESHPGEPSMPWHRHTGAPLWMPKNATTNDRYRGINIIMLWAVAEERQYTTPLFATYKQWQEFGAQVRGGEKGARIVKYGEYEVEPAGDSGDDDGRRLYLKGYTVFNASQVDGFPLPEAPPSLGAIERIERVETFLANLKAKVEIGGDRAFYRPSTDTIHMPDEGLFTGTGHLTRSEGWYAVLGHEHAHFTSHETRCARELGKRFGDQQYCAEELIAEIASAQLCALLGITQDVRPDHAQYLSQWMTLMRADNKAIFTAAAAASRAVDWMIAQQPPGAFPDLQSVPRAETAETSADAAAPGPEPQRPAPERARSQRRPRTREP